jgi:Synaptobrevin
MCEYLTKFQDPQQADTIMKVQAELDETKIVLHKTIESVLQRGEKLDNLVERSDALSAQSRMFYKTAKKQVQPLEPQQDIDCRIHAVLSCSRFALRCYLTLLVSKLDVLLNVG